MIIRKSSRNILSIGLMLTLATVFALAIACSGANDSASSKGALGAPGNPGAGGASSAYGAYTQSAEAMSDESGRDLFIPDSGYGISEEQYNLLLAS